MKGQVFILILLGVAGAYIGYRIYESYQAQKQVNAFNSLKARSSAPSGIETVAAPIPTSLIAPVLFPSLG